MLKHTYFLTKQLNSKKLFHYILIVTMIFFTDAILSFWLPTYLQDTFSSALVMGLIIGFSSVIGLITDFLFPQIFHDLKEKTALKLTLFFQTIFIGLLFLSLQFPYWWIFILAVSAWGLYFEFISFANKIYVADHISKKLYTNVWAEIDFGKSFAYLLGPLIASILLSRGNIQVLLASFATLSTAQLLLSFFSSSSSKSSEIKELKEVKKTPKVILEPKLEFNHWISLIKNAWPIILLSFLLTFIDATFWTSGAVFAEKIISDYPYAVFMIPLYIAPMLLSQIIMMKKEINFAKEKKATLLLLGASIMLFLLGKMPIGSSILIASFGIGLLISFAFPLIESTYSDLESRMGIHKKHLIGLSTSTGSIAYIIGPILAGFISQKFGEQTTFSLVGGIVFIASIFIMIFNYKKITIPQKEITNWDK